MKGIKLLNHDAVVAIQKIIEENKKLRMNKIYGILRDKELRNVSHPTVKKRTEDQIGYKWNHEKKEWMYDPSNIKYHSPDTPISKTEACPIIPTDLDQSEQSNPKSDSPDNTQKYNDEIMNVLKYIQGNSDALVERLTSLENKVKNYRTTMTKAIEQESMKNVYLSNKLVLEIEASKTIPISTTVPEKLWNEVKIFISEKYKDTDTTYAKILKLALMTALNSKYEI